MENPLKKKIYPKNVKKSNEKIIKSIITVTTSEVYSMQGPQVFPEEPLEYLIPLCVVQLWHKRPVYPVAHRLSTPPLKLLYYFIFSRLKQAGIL